MNASTSTYVPKPPPSPKTRPKKAAAFSQALELQRVCFNQAVESGTKPLERSSLARVWCELEEVKRKLKMKPLPKAIDVTKIPKHSRSKSGASFTEA